MAHSLEGSDRAAIDAIVASLEAAWNAGDGVGFAAPFAADADFVTIRAEHLRGLEAIGAGHAAIFRTIYAGSVNRYEIESARRLGPDVALVHVRSTLNAPTGSLAGTHWACFSLVMTREGSGWKIASLHNTLSPAEAPRH